MANRIELPGGVTADLSGPSPDTQAILQGLNQVIIALNTIAGQLDMILRHNVGAVPSHEIKARFRAHDQAVNEQMKSYESGGIPIDGDGEIHTVARKSNFNTGGETDDAVDESEAD